MHLFRSSNLTRSKQDQAGYKILYDTRRKCKFPGRISFNFPGTYQLSWDISTFLRKYRAIFPVHYTWGTSGNVQESVQEIMPCTVLQEFSFSSSVICYKILPDLIQDLV